MDIIKFYFTEVLKDGVCMSIEIILILRFCRITRRRRLVLLVDAQSILLRNSRAYVETF